MRHLLPLILILFSTQLFSQECKVFEPENSNELELQIQNILRSGFAKDADESCYEYKTAIHVIHIGEDTPTNISDETILSTWEQNQEYFSNSGEEFIDTAAATPFVFRLDTITRTNGAEVFGDGYLNDGIRLNGYGCPSGTGVSVGTITSYFENTLGFNDGVWYNIYIYKEVCSSNVIGFAYRTRPDLGAFVKWNYMSNARTLTHEIGHSWGLRHTFANTSSCIDTLGFGDGIDDTPVEPLTYSCNDICDGINSYNHMSYRNCRNQFTQGQVDYMLAVAAFNSEFEDIEDCEEPCVVDLENYGDFNGDGSINVSDFSLFSAAFGSEEGDENYILEVDANCDGIINIGDFNVFSANFGNSIEPRNIDFFGREINLKEHKGFYIKDYGKGIRQKSYK
jgi:hypothetical protein